MKLLRTTIFPILLTTVWISLSEFARNQFIAKSLWIRHYESLGLVFPERPVNGAIWGLWSLLFAILIFIISRKFSFIQTALITWFAGFVLMWVVIGNLGVLPGGLLVIAVPLSILEAFVAAFITVRTSAGNEKKGKT
jgi:hypothetical protein